MVKKNFVFCIVCLSFLLVSQLNLFSAESFILSGLGRPVNTFFTDNNIIYIMSWEKTEKGNTFYLYDMDGKFTQKKIIPIKYETDIQTYPIAVKNNKLYQLVENDREDEWELVITDL